MLTEKPASWKFELETPELGNPEAVTYLHAEAETGQFDGIFYDGMRFSFEGPVIVDAEGRWIDSDLSVKYRCRDGSVFLISRIMCGRALLYPFPARFFVRLTARAYVPSAGVLSGTAIAVVQRKNLIRGWKSFSA